jgi:hypothetical protein
VWIAPVRDPSYLDSKQKPPEDFCAPSWSWAATEGRVAFANGTHWVDGDDLQKRGQASIVRKYFESIGMETIPATVDMLGQVSDSTLRISGRVFNGTIRKRPDDNTYFDFHLEGSDAPFRNHSQYFERARINLQSGADFLTRESLGEAGFEVYYTEHNHR